MGTCLTAAGRVGQLFQLLSSNMVRVVIALTCLVAVSQAGVMEKIHRDFQNFNNNAMCWGHKNALGYHVALIQATEQCMQFGTPAAAFVKPANPFAQLTKPSRPYPSPLTTDGMIFLLDFSTATSVKLKEVLLKQMRLIWRSSLRTLLTGRVTWPQR